MSAKKSIVELINKAVQEQSAECTVRMLQHPKSRDNHLMNLMNDQRRNIFVNLVIYQEILMKNNVIKIASELEGYETDMVTKQMWKALIKQLNNHLRQLLLEEKIILQIIKLTGSMIKLVIEKMFNDFVSKIKVQLNHQ
ncbi:hypothetical protein HELRODRAFT_184618 [Helobdella robusta]|uniref:Uncharacterized protein n=1 Tax=Helobdella robusta TaxID=6412 RepID=T1FLC7_HELRO|nr:hypothetical protein HELRODRAFT_184618 [Helobdella robusta]XP_009028630.1 hypothetical protein HELRODRAFT_184507 [Helobdella robusta]ESN93272.1 hypothetical protein HELRODRAFT_184507 [Helobdella robusta]ESO08698.1 hypothetical protein HELRODRAFT_184618 [Helobdella robusta]